MQDLCFIDFFFYPAQHLVHTRLLIFKENLIESSPFPLFFGWGNGGLEEKVRCSFGDLLSLRCLRRRGWSEQQAIEMWLGWQRDLEKMEGQKMQTPCKPGEIKKKRILWNAYFCGQKKRLSEAKVERHPREEGVSWSRSSIVMWGKEVETKEDLRKGTWNWWVQAGPVGSRPPICK